MHIYLYLKHFPALADKLNDGPSRTIDGWASGLIMAGAKVTVLCENKNNSEFMTEAGYQVKCFANPETQPSFKLSPELKKYLDDRLIANNSLVILNGIFHPSLYSLSRLLIKYNIPYIVSPFDPYTPAIFKKKLYLKLPYWYLMERFILQQAIAVQVLDFRHKQWLHQLGIKTPVLEAPCGFYPKDVELENTLNWHKEGTIKLLFLGRLDAYNKGLDILLDAFAEIAENRNINLIIQGPDWGDKNKLEYQIAKLSIADKVSILKPDYNNSVSSLIENSDIFCLPSRFEGFSQVALEAMLTARVLLVSEIAGIVPYIQASDCGIVIKEPTVESVKVALLTLLGRRSEWREMGLRGRRYAIAHLTWQQIGVRLFGEYQKLLKI